MLCPVEALDLACRPWPCVAHYHLRLSDSRLRRRDPLLDLVSETAGREVIATRRRLLVLRRRRTRDAWLRAGVDPGWSDRALSDRASDTFACVHPGVHRVCLDIRNVCVGRNPAQLCVL